MKKTLLFFTLFLVLGFFSHANFANDKYTVKACMDSKEMAEKMGYDCEGIEEVKSTKKSKSKKGSDGKTPLDRLLELREKNKNGGTAASGNGGNGSSKNNQSTKGNSTNSSASSSGSCSYTGCTHYDFDNFKIGKWGGTTYSIRDGNKIVASHKKLEVMEKVDDFIRHYGVSSVCYVGDEFNRFMSIWYKTGSNARQILPAGSMRGEECISFNVNTAEVKHISGEWKIVDGKNWLFLFGESEREAHDALCLIKKYNLSKKCFAGSRRTLQYMRK